MGLGLGQGFLASLHTWGWAVLCGEGLFWALLLFGSNLGLSSLGCQQEPPTPSCVNQKCPQTLPDVPRGAKSPWVENHQAGMQWHRVSGLVKPLLAGT